MNKSYVIAGIIAVVATGWVLSGQFGEGSNTKNTSPASATTTSKTVKNISVRIRTINAQQWQQEIILRGKTEASRSVDVKAETVGRVTAISSGEGKRVKLNNLLVQIELAERTASLTEAKALLRQRTVENRAARALAKKGFRADTKLAESAAQLNSAKARVVLIMTDIARTAIRAPFDGILEKEYVELGDYLQIGDSVARIIDLNPILIVGAVSEREVAKLRLGLMATSTLIDGKKLTGRIRFIGRVADPVTRTFRIEIEISNEDASIRDGLTSEVRLPLEKIEAHFLSPTLLTLDAKGRLGVKGITAKSRVTFFPINLLANKPNGVWVSGLPRSVSLITVGQEYVQQGQTVNPVTYKTDQPPNS
jgi:membrane fusion protein, multidrug efflux system